MLPELIELLIEMAPLQPGTRFDTGTRDLFSPNGTPAPASAPAGADRPGTRGYLARYPRVPDTEQVAASLLGKQVAACSPSQAATCLPSRSLVS
ncbi:hypothetical protein PCASD_08108 [Puccinia coronata f. sp. avenae]|uniref:Uncharacterized protein n=1 Tax=Puccinia coronata f. sp. avenae TaxID=200324 RepID=A0A2N5VA94_9BASI|nr:hypothetical protein PCASD_08108 [Puccinia coronata f. sp. avenae]